MINSELEIEKSSQKRERIEGKNLVINQWEKLAALSNRRLSVKTFYTLAKFGVIFRQKNLKSGGATTTPLRCRVPNWGKNRPLPYSPKGFQP
ncbi:TPA: hypothetical protein ACJSA8_002149 [Streptococcus agalactiae]